MRSAFAPRAAERRRIEPSTERASFRDAVRRQAGPIARTVTCRCQRRPSAAPRRHCPAKCPGSQQACAESAVGLEGRQRRGDGAGDAVGGKIEGDGAADLAGEPALDEARAEALACRPRHRAGRRSRPRRRRGAARRPRRGPPSGSRRGRPHPRAPRTWPRWWRVRAASAPATGRAWRRSRGPAHRGGNGPSRSSCSFRAPRTTGPIRVLPRAPPIRRSWAWPRAMRRPASTSLAVSTSTAAAHGLRRDRLHHRQQVLHAVAEFAVDEFLLLLGAQAGHGGAGAVDDVAHEIEDVGRPVAPLRNRAGRTPPPIARAPSGAG